MVDLQRHLGLDEQRLQYVDPSLASKHLVNLTMNLMQSSWLGPCIRLLLDHRHCSTCLPEVEGGKSLLRCAPCRRGSALTAVSIRVARRSSARSPLLAEPCARSGLPQRPLPLPTSPNRPLRKIQSARKSLWLFPNRCRTLVVTRTERKDMDEFLTQHPAGKEGKCKRDKK